MDQEPHLKEQRHCYLEKAKDLEDRIPLKNQGQRPATFFTTQQNELKVTLGSFRWDLAVEIPKQTGEKEKRTRVVTLVTKNPMV